MKTAFSLLTGKSHSLINAECQDVVLAINDDNYTLGIICDGASTKKFGRRSAQLVANATAKFFKANNDIENFNSNVFCQFINEYFEEKDLDEEVCGSTLIFVIIKNGRYLLGHLGDGAALLQQDTDFCVASLPENAGTSNSTFFLPSSSAYKLLRITTGDLKEKFCFVLASDGISPLLYDYKTKTVCKACYDLADLYRKIDTEQMNKTLEHNLKEVFSKYTSDDLSILMITE